MALLQLEIVTPDKLVLCTEAEYVSVPGIEGEFGILPGHIPFLTALSSGCLHYNGNGKTSYVFVSGGFAEVAGNNVSILTDNAETAENIDFERAERAKQRAEGRIDNNASGVDHARAQAALLRSIKRLSLREKL